MIGRQLSHYRIVAELGSGGSGTVYRAEDLRHGRTVALKLPHPTGATDPAARARMVREARAASALHHPNIVPVLETGEADGTMFIAMAYVEGRTLRDLLPGPMPPGRVIAIGHALALALAHAHGRGVVHGDVKPDNVFLCDDGGVMLADFGIAHPAGDAGPGAGRDIVGTFAYVAPEALAGAPAAPAADLYALGVTLYELCVGWPPFAGAPAQLLDRAARETPPPLPVTVPSRLATLIERLLARDPGARPAAAAEVAAALAGMMPPGTPEPR